MPTKLARKRQERCLTQEELAERVGVAPFSIRRYEQGGRPEPIYQRKLCEVLEASPAELGFAPADPLQALRLEGVEQAVRRLCRDYSSTPPATLLPWVRQRLAQIGELQDNRLQPTQQRQLQVAAGWLNLLLAAVSNDLGFREPAWEARDLALYWGEESKDGNLTSWAYETPSWFALWDNRAADALDYAEKGFKVAPPGSSGSITNKLKLAQAHARMGRRLEAERELYEGRSELEKWQPPVEPDHHFVFDAAKYSFYASSTFNWLGQWRLVEENAREVIRCSSDPSTPAWVPTRVGMARLELTQSLALRGELDEALGEGLQAFGPWVRINTLTRATEVEASLKEHYPEEPGVQEFSERLTVARGRLGSE